MKVTHALTVLCALGLIWIRDSSTLYAQSSASSKPHAPIASLSKPLNMGIFDTRMFEDDAHKIRFRLETSWIPGEKNLGLMRYKLNMAVMKPASMVEFNKSGAVIVPDESPAGDLIKRIYRCKVSLDLYDKDRFVLRKHDVSFSVGVDIQEAHPSSLIANESLQMTVAEYREFSTAGSWSVSWACAP